jgi:putative superfamily III holin-X
MTAFEGPTAQSGAAPPRPDVSATSVGDLLSEISGDLSTLMRQEVELARAEIKQEVSKVGKGAGMLAGAGFAGYMVLLFASIAVWRGLSNVMDDGWAALIVTAIWAIAAAVLAVTGRNKLRTVHPTPERTVDTLKQVPDALKGQ